MFQGLGMNLKNKFSKLRELGLKYYSFWLVFLLFLGASCAFAWIMIVNSVEEERERMLAFLHSRAETMIWALESGARFCGRGRMLQTFFEEMGRQPGIAWLALVAADGRILVDSHSQLPGQFIYTQKEMASLGVDRNTMGRFSPDDPDIYETWKVFNPERLLRHGKMDPSLAKSLIFVALDARDFKVVLDNYIRHLALIYALVILSLAGIFIIILYAGKLNVSRRNLADARAFGIQVMKSYPCPFLVVDNTLRISFANGGAEEFFGPLCKPEAKLPDLKMLDWQSVLEEIRANRNVLDHEFMVADTKGRHIPISLSAAEICDVEGKNIGYMFIIKNMAEINILKNRLRQSERLSTLGKLASGLAHEIRNPLSSICGYAKYLQKKLDADPMAREAANLLVEETKRVNGVLADLLSLSKPPALNLQRNSLRDILEKTYKIIKPDADAKNIRLDLELENGKDNLPLVDRNRLTQAILNLLLNAMEAVAPGGKIGIGLKHVEEAESPAEKDLIGGQAQHWRIKVWDNGPGMTEKVKNQIFTPYFSTKASGSGLGLPITREIVNSHGGEIYVHSLPGEGTVFTILIPDGEGNER